MIPRVPEEKVIETILQGLKTVKEEDMRRLGETVVRICERDTEACLTVYRLAIFVTKVVEYVLRGGEEKEREE